MYSDIGIMQKLSERAENDVLYYYIGTCNGDFTCIIKKPESDYLGICLTA